jgi:hypothetical protein
MLMKDLPVYLKTCFVLVVMSCSVHAQTLSAENERGEEYNSLGVQQMAAGNYKRGHPGPQSSDPIKSTRPGRSIQLRHSVLPHCSIRKSDHLLAEGY